MAKFNSYAKDVIAIRRHNVGILLCAKEGDLLELPRGAYSHWAVFVGNGQVIHLAGEPGDEIKNVSVRLDSFWTVVETSMAKINNLLDDEETPLPSGEIVQRARMKVGHKGYNLLFTNCEHFATWCRYNKAKSKQIDTIEQGLSDFGKQLNQILTDAAREHPDEEKRATARNMLAFGEALGALKDRFFNSNKNEQLNGLQPPK